MKNCGHTGPCGCGESVIPMGYIPGCPTGCPTPKQCAEINPSKCLVYTGDTLANLGIYNGMNFDTIVQILGSFILGPGCMYPDSPCKSVVGLQTDSIGSSIVSLSWLPAPVGSTYIVQYKLSSDVNWTSNPSTTGTSDTIGGLAPNTTYLIRVVSSANNTSCNSLSLQIKTKV